MQTMPPPPPPNARLILQASRRDIIYKYMNVVKPPDSTWLHHNIPQKHFADSSSMTQSARSGCRNRLRSQKDRTHRCIVIASKTASSTKVSEPPIAPCRLMCDAMGHARQRGEVGGGGGGCLDAG